MAFDLHTRVFWLHVHSCTPQPPSPNPRIWVHIRGRYWSAEIDDITLCEPQAGGCLPRYTTAEELDNNKLAIIYYETQVQYKHNTLATGGKLMEPGLGTNPRFRQRVPTRSQTTPDTGCCERRGKSEVGK